MATRKPAVKATPVQNEEIYVLVDFLNEEITTPITLLGVKDYISTRKIDDLELCLLELVSFSTGEKYTLSIERNLKLI